MPAPLIDEIGVVTDQCITRPLGEQTEREDDDKAVTHAFRSEEVQVRRSLLMKELKSDGLLNFGIFELHSGIVFVSIGMIFGKHGQCLCVPVL